MTHKENITAILECYFAGFKKEIIDSACNRILEQESSSSEIPNKSEISTGSTTKNDLEDDCISRKAVLEMAKSYNTDGWDMYTPLVVDVEDIEELPSVTPIRPKGYWREVDTNMYACSKCSHVLTIDPLDNSILEMNTCPFCSADMRDMREV